ncbi:alpha/beta fold hydrolase [Maioricimonas sp. JC845]|uniref:alpha/beta hydrolase n=1 Tax=Maioricimonas sp. JC845 TaxID=3232138 RepID=UPI00345A8C5D
MRLLFRLRYVACASVLVVAGCLAMEEGEQSAMAPDEFGPAMPASAAPEPGAMSVIRVFYGTNRRAARGISPASDPNDYYTSNSGELQYGFCDVSIPPTHEYGEVERPSIWRLEFSEDPDRHVVLRSIRPTGRDQFMAELQDDVAGSTHGEAFVFVHGYNVTFAEAARRTGQMAHDLKFDGPPILFSWPSHGDLTGYVADITSAERSVSQVIDFVEAVARDSGARRIHLVAHSMGNRVVTNVLKRLAEESAYREIPRFNEVILAAPDVDAETFRHDIAPKIVDTADRVTIYASSNDLALRASEAVNRGRRLGQGGSDLTTFPEVRGIDVVDASDVDFSLFDLGHSAYGDELLGEIRQVFAGREAPQRGLKPHKAKPAWLLKPHRPPSVVEEPVVRPVGYPKVEEKTVEAMPAPEPSGWSVFVRRLFSFLPW